MSRNRIQTCAVELHLRICASNGKRDELLAFLRSAKPYYESPGGIRMRLLQDHADPDRFIEIFEYATLADFEADEHRVNNDEKMKALLATWRSLLDGPPVVEVFTDISESALGMAHS